MSTHANMVKMTVSSVDADPYTITLNAASSGYQSFADAFGGNATVDILITMGTTWEVARDCTYTHSGTTVTRGTFEDSSTGSRITTFDNTAVVSVTSTAALGNDLESAKLTYIAGLVVTKNSGGNTLDISAGKCYDPSSSKIISYAGATGVSAGTLGASQWNQVYIYDNAGTATIEVVNNASPPSTAYAGTARQGGTNSNRRWIGCFLTNGSSNILSYVTVLELPNAVAYTYPAIFRVLNAGVATTFTAVSLATCIPRYVVTTMSCTVLMLSATSAGNSMTLSTDGTSENAGAINITSTPTAAILSLPIPCNIDKETPQIYYKMYSAVDGYMDVFGFTAAR